MNYYILFFDYKIGWDRGVPIDYIRTPFLLQITLKFWRYFQSIEFFFVNLQVIKGYRDAYEARIEERAG